MNKVQGSFLAQKKKKSTRDFFGILWCDLHGGNTVITVLNLRTFQVPSNYGYNYKRPLACLSIFVRTIKCQKECPFGFVSLAYV